MKKFKSVLAVAAAFLLAAAFAGCGEYKPPADTGDESQSGISTPQKPGDNTTDPEVQNAFTASLRFVDGTPFTSENYGKITEMQAQWTNNDNKNEVFRAYFDSEGVAKCPNLDGDYTVTLIGLPEGYTYKSNIEALKASNISKDVNVILLPILNLGNRAVYGPNKIPYYTLDQSGAYRITLNEELRKTGVMFSYRPSRSGSYSLETFADVTANEVNPKLAVFAGNLPAYMNEKPFSEQDGGGYENTYTKNIKWVYELDASKVGGSLIFKLYAESRFDNVEDLEVDFVLERDGEFTRTDWLPSKPVPIPDYVEKNGVAEKPAGTFTFCAKRPGVSDNILSMHNVYNDADKDNPRMTVKKNPDDGYWYYYDNVAQKYTDKIYAMLGSNNEVHSWFGNSYLQAMLGYMSEGEGKEARNYINFVNAFLSKTNGDGAYPVTDELKDFLQTYAKAQSLFRDGKGYAEQSGTIVGEDDYGNVTSEQAPGYQSDEDSQWMYACGYYRT